MLTGRFAGKQLGFPADFLKLLNVHFAGTAVFMGREWPRCNC